MVTIIVLVVVVLALLGYFGHGRIFQPLRSLTRQRTSQWLTHPEATRIVRQSGGK